MTFREVPPDEVLAALGDGGDDAVLRACIDAVRARPRAFYTIGGTPADSIRRILERRYRRATSRGKAFLGEKELFTKLAEVDGEPIAPVTANLDGRYFLICVSPDTLKPVAAMIMYDVPPDQEPSRQE
jgi:hypothetical protein